MGDKTGIQWTDATWNPFVGCSLCSPGCTNCYAMKQAARIIRMSKGHTHYTGTVQESKAGPVWSGKLEMAPDSIFFAPLHWKRPRMIFANSMSDMFHENAPDHWIDESFAVMALARQHIFQILTKRSERMFTYCDLEMRADELTYYLESPAAMRIEEWTYQFATKDYKIPYRVDWPLPNVWLGVSVEDRARLYRLDHLRKTPAAKRFVSFEPLLEDLGEINLTSIDWAIIGGESGADARDHDIDWDRRIIAQCKRAGVAVFEKQLGSKPLLHGFTGMPIKHEKGGDPNEWPEDLQIREIPA